MAKARLKLKASTTKPNQAGWRVDRSAAQHSRYIKHTAYIPMDAANDEYGHFLVDLNIEQDVVGGWLYDNDGFFTPQHEQMIAVCKQLWSRCVLPRFADQTGRGYAKALATLAEMKRKVPRYAWEIFENVCRWDEPTGIPGSRYATARPSSVRAAKHVVRYVAEELSL